MKLQRTDDAGESAEVTIDSVNIEKCEPITSPNQDCGNWHDCTSTNGQSIGRREVSSNRGILDIKAYLYGVAI